MFKGLRTKIESEQKSQSNVKGGLAGPTRQHQGTGRSIDPDAKRISASSSPSGSSAEAKSHTLNISDGYPSITTANSNIPSKSAIASSSTAGQNPTITKAFETTQDHGTGSSQTGHNSSGYIGDQRVEELQGQISKLQVRLQAVIKERDLDIDQNAQSNRLIAALRRDLEQEKVSKVNLEKRLHESELKLKEQTDNVRANNQSGAGNRAANNNAFIKSFNPDGHHANISDTTLSDDVNVLRHDILDLQAQLAKKNRQLKISQQNLTDMKKSLQKEILEHSKTQDELAKLKGQFKKDQETTLSVKSQTEQQNSHIPNGSNIHVQSDKSDQTPSDKRQEGQINAAPQAGNLHEDSVSLNANSGISNQFDRVSCMSGSSASVDDFDSNDLQNSHHKEVSHEYLRNVLFRYMTSTDTETTQHLVKAISVLMDFSPEQSAAIKKAMMGKGSSWLRLK